LQSHKHLTPKLEIVIDLDIEAGFNPKSTVSFVAKSVSKAIREQLQELNARSEYERSRKI